MDNLTHTLIGMALARARIVPDGALVTTAFVLGANAPDVDLAWSTGNDLAYYELHRGWTHALAGAPLLAVALWIVLLGLGRLAESRLGARARPGPLLAACALGVASHVALDAANAYGVRPYLPWSDAWVYGDLFMIVDPWIWLLLGGALYLGRRPGRVGALAWTLLAALVTAAMATLPIVPHAALPVWIALLAAVVVQGRRRGAIGDPSGRLARGALALLVVYAGICLASRSAASGRLSSEAQTSRAEALLPRPADPFRWNAFWVDGANVRGAVVGAIQALDRPEDRFERAGARDDDPAVAAVLATCAGRVVHEFFRFPLASVEPGADGSARVRLRDLRFALEGAGHFAVFEATVDASGHVGIDPAACP